MKKWAWMLGCIILVVGMAGCKEAEGTEAEVVDKENQQSDNEDDETNYDIGDLEELQKSVAESHLDTLYNMIENVGFMEDRMDFYDGAVNQGLVYAKIVDFNNDQVDELITVVKGLNFNEEDGPYAHDEYVLEIWGTDYNTYGVLYSKNIPIDECSACDLGIMLFGNDDNLVGFVETSMQMVQGTTYSTENYYEMLKAGQFEVKTTQSADGEEEDRFTINDKEVSRKEYNAFINGYQYEAIIVATMGNKGFPMFPSAGKMVTDIYAQYATYIGFETLLAEGTEVEPYTIQAEAEYVLYTDRVDTLDRSMYNDMLAQMIYNTYLEADMPEVDDYHGYSSWQVVDKFLQTYGAELQLEDVEFLRFADMTESSREGLLYDEGTFYLYPPDLKYMMTIRSVQRAVKIEDHYYLEVFDTDFNWYAYDGFSDGPSIEDFIYEPIANWPHEAVKWAKSNIPRYIVIEIAEETGLPRFKYIGYRPLNLESVMPYILSFRHLE